MGCFNKVRRPSLPLDQAEVVAIEKAKPADAQRAPREPASWPNQPPPAFNALKEAVERFADEGSGFTLYDIGRVDSFWEVLDCFSSSHGFVVQLRAGERLYLERMIYPGEDEETIEHYEIRNMGDERYPHFDKGGYIDWIDDALELNRFLQC